MVALGREHGVEVCLFVGPRCDWDIGTQATSAAGGRAAAERRRCCAAPTSSRTGSRT
ncbi:hypothetical protein [Streptomyces sp. NPDC097610]|uniref:hypothetical protein n=1 Tax=Streptomyces sp. NPDC097610 TaxID=3157227 RepID=UPI003316B82D